MQPGVGPSVEDLYRASYHLGNQNLMHNDPVRFISSLFFLLDLLIVSHQSPPNHNISNPALKGPLRPSHIRARVAASPYPRDTDSVHSSSSETEDISMYLGSQNSDYQAMFGGQTMAPSQEAIHAAGAFGRMTLSPDHALEKLATNVRVATTTSASDRAKQIFVQAWSVSFCYLYDFVHGLLLTIELFPG